MGKARQFDRVFAEALLILATTCTGCEAILGLEDTSVSVQPDVGPREGNDATPLPDTDAPLPDTDAGLDAERDTALDRDGAPGCGPEEIACEAGCKPIDTSNCYSCGTVCSGATPACLRSIGACGCNDDVCAADGGLCDLAKGQCVADPTPIRIQGIFSGGILRSSDAASYELRGQLVWHANIQGSNDGLTIEGWLQ